MKPRTRLFAILFSPEAAKAFKAFTGINDSLMVEARIIARRIEALLVETGNTFVTTGEAG